MGAYRWLLCPGSSRLLSVVALLLQPPASSSSSQHPRMQPSALTAFCSPSLMGFFFNWKKQKLQSLHAGRRHVQPCVPASRRRSPPLPLCAHQTKPRLLMPMLLGQSGLTLPLLPPPLPNSITQPPRWEQLRSDHRPKPTQPPAAAAAAALLAQRDPAVLAWVQPPCWAGPLASLIHAAIQQRHVAAW